MASAPAGGMMSMGELEWERKEDSQALARAWAAVDILQPYRSEGVAQRRESSPADGFLLNELPIRSLDGFSGQTKHFVDLIKVEGDPPDMSNVLELMNANNYNGLPVPLRHMSGYMSDNSIYTSQLFQWTGGC